MSKVTSHISMSLDGFITDPKASIGTPLETVTTWADDGISSPVTWVY